jgi:gluconolactonase
MKTIRQIFSVCFVLLLAYQFTIAKNTYKIEKIINGFSHPEAILWIDANPPYLLFSDIIDQKIYKISENNKVEMLLDNVGKCNGIIQDNDANLIISQENNRQISILKNNVLESMISTFKNKKFNSPFGLGIKKTTNTLYFTDPNYGINSSQEELGYYGIYAYQTSKKVMTLLIDSIVKPKYLAFSPDEWFMYISNSENNKIYKIEMKNDTSVRKVSILASFNNKINGLQCDLDGNIYVANANEGIKIFSFNGNLIDQITIADTVRNFTFASNKIIYATATDGIYKITINPENPFIMNEYLGRVSDKSITINMMSESDGTLIVDYGIDKQNLNFTTQEMPFSVNVPIEIVLNNLESNSNYYYRVKYKTNTNQNYIKR